MLASKKWKKYRLKALINGRFYPDKRLKTSKLLHKNTSRYHQTMRSRFEHNKALFCINQKADCSKEVDAEPVQWCFLHKNKEARREEEKGESVCSCWRQSNLSNHNNLFLLKSNPNCIDWPRWGCAGVKWRCLWFECWWIVVKRPCTLVLWRCTTVK